MAEIKSKEQKAKSKEITKKAAKTAPKNTKTEKVEATAPVAEKAAAPRVARATKAKTANLTVDLYDVAGKVSGTVSLPEAVFGAKVNKQLIAQAVRIYLANQRAGSASTKSRGEVKGSSRKIYRQKGTGRARHGGVRAPIFVHGGIAHGPKPHDFSMKMPQKMKRAALFATLSLKAQTNAVKVIDGLETMAPKTKLMAALLSTVAPEAKDKKVLVVIGGKQDNVSRAARNIPGVTYEQARQLNAYEVMNHKAVVFMKQAIEEVEKTFSADKETK